MILIFLGSQLPVSPERKLRPAPGSAQWTDGDEQKWHLITPRHLLGPSRLLRLADALTWLISLVILTPAVLCHSSQPLGWRLIPEGFLQKVTMIALWLVALILTLGWPLANKPYRWGKGVSKTPDSREFTENTGLSPGTSFLDICHLTTTILTYLLWLARFSWVSR